MGYFSGDILYSNNGKYIGEIYRDDWTGKLSGVVHPTGGSRVGYAGIAVARHANRSGLDVAGWEDLDF